MRRLRDYLIGLAILVAGPLAVIAGLWLWVASGNGSLGTGRLQCITEQTLGWIGAPIGQVARFSPAGPVVATAPPPVDLLIMVDVSGSTASSRTALIQAVDDVADELLRSNRDNRVALASFETDATLHVNWTSSPTAVRNAAAQLADLGGANDSRAAFDLARRTLDAANRASRRIVVFYTDGDIVSCQTGGCPSPRFEWSDIAAGGERLRATGAEIYAVGIPGYLNPQMESVTGSPSRLLTIDRQGQILGTLRQLVAGPDAQRPFGTYAERVDGRLFSVAVGGPEWAHEQETVTRTVPGVPNEAASFAHGLVPRVHGVVPLTLAPPTLSWLDADAKLVQEQCPAHQALVISPLFLLFALFPALGWTVYSLVPPRREPAPPPVGIPDRLPPAASPVLRLPSPTRGRGPVTPTLFIGLGGWGRGAVQAARRALIQAHAGEPGPPPYQFLAIDIDSTPRRGDGAEAALTAVPAVRTVTAPPEVTDLYNKVNWVSHASGPYAGMQLRGYQNAPRQTVTLTSGSHGDRTLARIALLRWFESDQLRRELESALHTLRRQPGPGGARQIVLFARGAGGFGSASLLDVARVLRRQMRDMQQGGELVPEIVAVIEGGAQDTDDRERRDTLLREDATTRRFGLYPRRVVLREGDALLDRVDVEAPLDTLLAIADPADAAGRQAGALAAVLVDPQPRQAMLTEVADSIGPVAAVQATELTVRPAHVRSLVAEEFIRRIIYDHLLGGSIRTAGGERPYETMPPTPEDADAALDSFVAAEPESSPWRKLVAARHSGNGALDFITALENVGEDNLEWMSRAAAQSISDAFASTALTARPLTPVVATAALRALVDRLRGRLRTEATGVQASAESLTLMEALAHRLHELALSLDHWAEALVAELCEATLRQQHLLQSMRERHPGATALDQDADDKTIARWLADTFAAATSETGGGADVLFGRIAFSVAPDGAALLPVVRCRVVERNDLRSVQDAVAMLHRTAEAVAGLVPAGDVAHAVAGLEPEAMARRAQDMVPNTRASGVLYTQPDVGTGPPADALRTFFGQIGERADRGVERVAVATDHSALRRIGWWRVPPPARGQRWRLAQPTDLLAELMRARIVHYMQRDIPELSPELALAVADHERFRAFAAAYSHGHLRRGRDLAGREVWRLGDRFITRGASLAEAAAAFTTDERIGAAAYAPTDKQGDFGLLDQARDGTLEEDRQADPDIWVLAAMRIALEDA